MRLSRWFLLLGTLVGVGCLRVMQQNAIVLKGYAVGERLARVHRQETELFRLRAQVAGLASPTHLSRVAQEQQLKLVAWSTLSPTPSLDSALPAELLQAGAQGTRPLTHVAALDPDQPSGDLGTSD